MDLILWRHAEAREPREVQDDLDRALTPKGERQAQRMADWLNRQLPIGARVLVSPARRAQQTASALDRKFAPCRCWRPTPRWTRSCRRPLAGEPRSRC
jgi:phosphohistidine phosphatase